MTMLERIQGTRKMLGLFSGLSIKEKKEDDEIISSKETKMGEFMKTVTDM